MYSCSILPSSAASLAEQLSSHRKHQKDRQLHTEPLGLPRICYQDPIFTSRFMST